MKKWLKKAGKWLLAAIIEDVIAEYLKKKAAEEKADA